MDGCGAVGSCPPASHRQQQVPQIRVARKLIPSNSHISRSIHSAAGHMGNGIQLRRLVVQQRAHRDDQALAIQRPVVQDLNAFAISTPVAIWKRAPRSSYINRLAALTVLRCDIEVHPAIGFPVEFQQAVAKLVTEFRPGWS